MIELLAPIGLVALSALIIPILIHLVRRSERQLVSFAALRWLSERSRPRKQIRLHERLLLLLRLLLLAVLALLLALPVWRSAGVAGPRWVGVAPGVDAAAARAAVADATAEWHWLASGFPLIDNPGIDGAGTPPDRGLISRIRELDAMLPAKTPLTLVVPTNLHGLDAERLHLSREVAWLIRSDGASAASPHTESESLHISIRNDAQGVAELPVIRAMAQAWSVAGFKSILDIADGNTPIPSDAETVFWIAGEPSDALLKWVDTGGTLVLTRVPKPEGTILFADDTHGDAAILFEARKGQGRLLQFPGALTLEANPVLREPESPERLRQVLFPPPAAPDEVRADAFKPSLSDRVNKGVAKPLANWLIVLAALLFLAERWLATGPRRGAE